MTAQKPSRPSSAMASLAAVDAGDAPVKESWLKKNFMGRTPSLPTSLSKKKQSFLKKLHRRKISAPSFASNLIRRPNQSSTSAASLSGGDSLSRPDEASLAARWTDNDEVTEDVLACGCQTPTPPSPSRIPSNPDELNWITSMDEAKAIIEAMRLRCQCRGRQIMAYRKKLHQQRCEMRQMEADHQNQLEGISLELMHFESSLRTKENQIDTMLATKDQVIVKQQKLIKKLLRRGRRSSSNDVLDGQQHSAAAVAASTEVTTNTNSKPGDYEALNDSSDSAIAGEVSLIVPTLASTKSAGTATVMAAEEETAVAAAATGDQTRSENEAISSDQPQASNNGRKTKDDRQRISNRQKLLLLKRHHSGYLKRPEILETVYSVEEDGENAQDTRCAQAAAAAAAAPCPPPANSDIRSEVAAAAMASNVSIRRRVDSTTNSDCSTDELCFSETETACSCSLQSCSRRSSCGFCMAQMVTASAPGSRRSSSGSSVAAGQTFNRVMSNHRSMTKPKDVKFKRINKAKSRSLEELRGKLTRSTDEDIEDLDLDEDAAGSILEGGACGNGLRGGTRLTSLRAMLGQQRQSLSLDQESTDASTN